ncbi:hypothetical protein ACHAXN_006694 [Cyclotella atomus]
MSTIPGKRPKLDIALAKNDDELDQPSHPDEEDTNDDHDMNMMQSEEVDQQQDSGPKFHTNERVLVLDSTRQSQESSNETNQPPLYEATIKQSGLRNVDPVTKKVLSETKFAFSKKRGRRRHLHQAQQQHDLHDQEKEWCYLIHFLGWNSRHDKWMPETDVFPNTEENRQRLEGNTPKVARAVKTESLKEKKKKKIGRPKKEDGNDGGDSKVGKMIEACALPFTLQRILIDDRDKITQIVYPPASGLTPRDPAEVYKKGITMLHKLPSSMNIQSILARFLEAKKKEDLEEFVKERDKMTSCDVGAAEGSQKQLQASEDEAGKPSKPNDTTETSANKIISKDVLMLRKKKRKQLALSLLEVVDTALPKILLYAKERRQYEELMSRKECVVNNESNDKETETSAAPPSKLYGGEHLLRLFVKLPLLLRSDEEVVGLAGFLSDFIVFMQKNRAECFKGQYYAIYRDGNRCIE